MFKKTEESEWTRFSRALGGKDQPREREEPGDPEGELVEESPATTATPVAAVTPPAQAGSLSTTPPLDPAPTAVQPGPDRIPAAPELAFTGESPTGPVPITPTPSAEPPTFAEPSFSPTVGSRRIAEEDAESVIAEGTEMEGVFRAEHSIRVRGAVQGEIASKRRIVVEQGASVNAKVSAEQITILGEVNGEVTCPGRVEIAPNGRVTGEISAGTLVMQEGGFFEGQLKMLSKGG
jgi:cytoskeletal protein CcmA (bactofilin family)